MNEWIKEKREIWVNIISNHLLVNQLGFLKDINRDSQDGPIFRNTSDLLVQVLISDQYSGHSAPLQPVGAGTDCCSTSLHPSPENSSASQSVSLSIPLSAFILHLSSVSMAADLGGHGNSGFVYGPLHLGSGEGSAPVWSRRPIELSLAVSPKHKHRHRFCDSVHALDQSSSVSTFPLFPWHWSPHQLSSQYSINQHNCSVSYLYLFN